MQVVHAASETEIEAKKNLIAPWWWAVTLVSSNFFFQQFSMNRPHMLKISIAVISITCRNQDAFIGLIIFIIALQSAEVQSTLSVPAFPALVENSKSQRKWKGLKNYFYGEYFSVSVLIISGQCFSHLGSQRSHLAFELLVLRVG